MIFNQIRCLPVSEYLFIAFLISTLKFKQLNLLRSFKVETYSVDCHAIAYSFPQFLPLFVFVFVPSSSLSLPLDLIS